MTKSRKIWGYVGCATKDFEHKSRGPVYMAEITEITEDGSEEWWGRVWRTRKGSDRSCKLTHKEEGGKITEIDLEYRDFLHSVAQVEKKYGIERQFSC